MKTKQLLKFGCLLLPLTSFLPLASPYLPDSLEVVVATWQVKENEEFSGSVLDKAKWHAEQTNFPGNASIHAGQAQALNSKIQPDHPFYNSAEHRYLSAQLLQKKHQFDKALNLLDELTDTHPEHINGWLMKANIYLTQGRYKQAKQACLKLAGQTSGLVFSACALDVAGYTDDLSNAYQQLAQLRSAFNSQPKAVKDWISQILADQAMRMGNADEAAEWLNTEQLASKTTSYITLWADAQLALENYQMVAEQLNEIMQNSGTTDDSLLIRVSLAEKQLGKDEWRSELDQRMQLRIARNDQFHASDLARYFLDIASNPDQALYWASINWQQAKLHADMMLLERAIQMKEEQKHG